MSLRATGNNVIFAVKIKEKSKEELLVDTGEKESILIGDYVAAGPLCDTSFDDSDQICAYINRVAVIPWALPGYVLYCVKEENICAIQGEDDE